MKIIRIDEMPQIKDQAAAWFSEKWDAAADVYVDSINESLNRKQPFPAWYLLLNGDEIVAGAGVISNDPQIQKEKRPNICAVYVEETYRGKGIAGALLEYICVDMLFHGITTLYLITEMDSFYERYGWEFIAEITDNEEQMRLYKHQINLTGR